jgi:hypothetical protein
MLANSIGSCSGYLANFGLAEAPEIAPVTDANRLHLSVLILLINV